MHTNDILHTLGRLVDGQTIKVTVASGRVFDGVYDGEKSNEEDGLYFESFDGKPLRAEWENVTTVGGTSARATAGNMMVPPEHPLSGKQNQLRAYTLRNPTPGADAE